MKLQLILKLFTITLFAFCSCGNNERDNKQSTNNVSQQGKKAAITKEGSLTFFNQKRDEIIKIDIEVADNDAEITQGLMHRTGLTFNQGMLFIFEADEQQTFWMKNTPTALDIIFVNSNQEIVSIHKNAVPYSEESIESNAEAMYVVEVKAGFCDKFTIEVGQQIDFSVM